MNFITFDDAPNGTDLIIIIFLFSIISYFSEPVHHRLRLFGGMDGIGVFNFNLGGLPVANRSCFNARNRLGWRNFGHWWSRRYGARWMAGKRCRPQKFIAADGYTTNRTFSLLLCINYNSYIGLWPHVQFEPLTTQSMLPHCSFQFFPVGGRASNVNA